MGQAKRRGTFEERKAQARARDFPHEAAEIRRRAGLPAIEPKVAVVGIPRHHHRASMAMARLMAAALVIGLPLNKDCVKERTP